MRQKNYLWLIIWYPDYFYQLQAADNNWPIGTRRWLGTSVRWQNMDGWRDFKGEAGTVTLHGHWKRKLTALAREATVRLYCKWKEYGNFIITFDWKIAEGGNSGLLYHVLNGRNIRSRMLQAPNISWLMMQDFLTSSRNGRNRSWLCQCICPITVKSSLQKWWWNRSKIVFDNGHVEYWLNDQNFWNLKHGQRTGLHARKQGNGICSGIRTCPQRSNCTSGSWQQDLV